MSMILPSSAPCAPSSKQSSRPANPPSLSSKRANQSRNLGSLTRQPPFCFRCILASKVEMLSLISSTAHRLLVGCQSAFPGVWETCRFTTIRTILGGKLTRIRAILVRMAIFTLDINMSWAILILGFREYSIVTTHDPC